MAPGFPLDRALSRRDLLRLGVGAGVATAGAVLLPSFTDAAFAASSDVQAAQFSTDLYSSPTPQRFSVILIKPTSKVIRTDVAGPPVEVRFRAPGASWGPYVPLTLDTEGLPRGRGVYRTGAVFDQAGNWKVQARIDGRTANVFTQPVAETAVAPVPGQPAPRAASPTTTDSLGVDPICTRVPPCPLHTTSLADVIGSGTPVAVLFATPALCQSAYCGPVLDELLDVMVPYQERVTFVHVDIYKNRRGVALSPTVEAWGTPRSPGERKGLPSEPWLFGIDGAGTITGRLDTAFGKTEMVELLDDLIAT